MYLLILAWFGAVGGVALASIAPEELDDGRKYFRALSAILGGVISGMTLMAWNDITGMILALLISLMIYLVRIQQKWFHALIMVFVGLTVGSFSQSGSALIATLLFIYGLFCGTLDADNSEAIGWKKGLMESMKFVPTLVAGMISYFVLTI